jgi:hypothetical protein
MDSKCYRGNGDEIIWEGDEILDVVTGTGRNGTGGRGLASDLAAQTWRAKTPGWGGGYFGHRFGKTVGEED